MRVITLQLLQPRILLWSVTLSAPLNRGILVSEHSQQQHSTEFHGNEHKPKSPHCYGSVIFWPLKNSQAVQWARLCPGEQTCHCASHIWCKGEKSRLVLPPNKQHLFLWGDVLFGNNSMPGHRLIPETPQLITHFSVQDPLFYCSSTGWMVKRMSGDESASCPLAPSHLALIRLCFFPPLRHCD